MTCFSGECITVVPNKRGGNFTNFDNIIICNERPPSDFVNKCSFGYFSLNVNFES